MNYTKLAYLIPAGLLVVATACGPKADTIEKKSESTTQTAEGTVKTTSESTQVGTTLDGDVGDEGRHGLRAPSARRPRRSSGRSPFSKPARSSRS